MVRNLKSIINNIKNHQCHHYLCSTKLTRHIGTSGGKTMCKVENSNENTGEKKSNSNSESGNGKSEVLPEETPNMDDLVVPTTCCMSGCTNCVWIQYAEKLTNIMKSSGEDVQKIIMEKVEDPNMKSFLTMELRLRKIIK